MDCSFTRQDAIEMKLAAKHLAAKANPSRIASFEFELTSPWVTGRRQLAWTGFGLARLVLVGDRGMSTSHRSAARTQRPRRHWICDGSPRCAHRRSPRRPPTSGRCTAARLPRPASGRPAHPRTPRANWRPPKHCWQASPRIDRGTLAGTDKMARTYGKVFGKMGHSVMLRRPWTAVTASATPSPLISRSWSVSSSSKSTARVRRMPRYCLPASTSPLAHRKTRASPRSVRC